jgi:hypothetical protein
VQVRHGEGVAIRIDPEPCAVVRKGDSEASVGERIGQPLSTVTPTGYSNRHSRACSKGELWRNDELSLERLAGIGRKRPLRLSEKLSRRRAASCSRGRASGE